MRITNRIKEEFRAHAEDRINDGVITLDNQSEWHYHLFNEDYYIVGYHESSEWLKEHNIGELEGANYCVQYEKENFGECNKEYDNTEVVVNMLAYILGEEWISDEGEDFILEILEDQTEEEE